MENLSHPSSKPHDDAQTRMLRALRIASEQLERTRLQYSEPLAVVGMACRFPGASSVQGFWELLNCGRNAIRKTPEDRWSSESFTARAAKQSGKITFNGGGLLDEIDRFDARFFEISQREARSMDPQQRLLLEIAWEALEDAGMPPASLKSSRSGVFVGMCSSDYLLRLAQSPPEEIDTYFSTGNSHGAAAGRLSYFLQWEGPSLAVDTACSSSLVAVHLAAQSIYQNDCELALATGVNIIASPNLSISLSQAGMLSPDGQCHTFSAAANGFVRGEGCGAVLLKRLSHAQRDGDRIICLLRGSAVNQDGRSNGLTAPNSLAQQSVLRAALAKAGLAPDEIDYIEAHGTGTELGDPIEMNALQAVFADRKTPLLVGSAKTNIGHLEGAAGIAGLIKTCLALHHEAIPAHLNFDVPSPHIDWNSPIRVATELTPWVRSTNRPRRAGVSSFGFGGTNAHLIVEEAPAIVRPQFQDASDVSLQSLQQFPWLKVSAKSEAALVELALRYAQALESPDLARYPIGTIIAATNLGRSDFPYRLLVAGERHAQIVEELQNFVADHRSGAWARGATCVPAAEVHAPIALADNHLPTSLFGDGHHAWASTKHRAFLPVDSSTQLKLALNYVRGEFVNWKEVYPRCAREVSLPTYPFQRQRCWFREVASELATTGMTNAGPIEKMVARSSATTAARSFLGQRLDVAGSVIVFESDLSDFPVLADHVVCGQTIFPAAGYLQLAHAAAIVANGEASPSSASGEDIASEEDSVASNYAVQNLHLTRALAWQPGSSCRIQTVLHPAAEGFRCTISSRQSEHWIQHAECELVRGPSELEAIPQALNDETLWEDYCLDEHYRKCYSAGLNYGPAFQGLISSKVRKSQVVGEVKLPRSAPDLDAYPIHPALLDACFQALAPLIERGSSLWLPVGIDRWDVNDPFIAQNPQWRLCVTGVLHPAQDASVRSADLYLTSIEGTPVAKLTGFRVQHMGLPERTAVSRAVQEAGIAIAPDPLTDKNLPLLANLRDVDHLTGYLRQRLAEIIDCDAAEIDDHAPLETLGLDSLMAFELLDDLKKNLAVDLPMERFLAGITLSDLVTAVLQSDTAAGCVGSGEHDLATHPGLSGWIEGAL